MQKPFCPTCKEDLREIEAEFMIKKGFIECVKCRAKKQPMENKTGVDLSKKD